MARLGGLPPGSRGFDCNVRLTALTAAVMKRAGFQFAGRYVRRAEKNNYDLTTSEVALILQADLGLTIFQHVAPEGWLPTNKLGTVYGATAAKEAEAVGIPHGAVLWCDLEGVSRRAPVIDVIGFCNMWYQIVHDAGFDPGLYVGDSCGLSAVGLYKNLRFRRYCGAYNLNNDNIPIIRDLQMKQSAYPPVANRAPVSFEYDVETILVDHLGGTPVLVLP